MRRIVKRVLFILVLVAMIAACFPLAPRATHLHGHTGSVGDAVLAPDGRHLASVSYGDRTVRVWDADTREQLAVVSIGDKDYPGVAFSSDSKLFAVGGKDGAVTVFRIDGTEVRRCGGQAGVIRAVAFSPDGEAVASGSEDGTVKVWDIATGTEIWSLRAHHHLTRAVIYSPDGKLLVSGGSADHGRHIQIWDARTGKERSSLVEAGGYIRRLAFSPNSGTLCSASHCDVSLWDMATGRNRDFESPEWLDLDDGYVDALAFSPDSRTLAAGHEDAIGLWDVASGKNTQRFPREGSRLLSLADRFLLRPDRSDLDSDIMTAAFRPNGDLMVAGATSFSKTVAMWRLTSVPLAK